jgi:hypothetical protein
VNAECPREQEVVQAVLAGAWSTVDDQDLKAHTAECASCAEIATIAALMRDDNDHARRNVRVPAAGQVWWRAAVRARLEKTQAATQPITWMHGITAAVTIGILLAAVSFAWPALTSNVIGFREAFAWVLPSGEVTTAIIGAFRQSLTLALIVTACLVLAPIALYFALSD